MEFIHEVQTWSESVGDGRVGLSEGVGAGFKAKTSGHGLSEEVVSDEAGHSVAVEMIVYELSV